MTMRGTAFALVAVLLTAAPSFPAHAGENVWYSVFVPGWGQVRAGHYGRGSLFLSAEIVSLTTLMISDIQYNRAVEQYDRARSAYVHASYIGDAVSDYNLMRSKWDSADELYGIRRAALWTAVGVWALNIADMALLDRRGEPPLAFETRPGGFLVTASLSF
jgi:hypothetical protein